MAKFEVITKYADAGLTLPERKTANSAGYDFYVAEDTLIPPMEILLNDLVDVIKVENIDNPLTLDEMNNFSKMAHARPTLIPTGIKANLDRGTYLELVLRSSCPLKYWIIMANSVGVIDSDYYNNPDNEGHIYFQVINLSPVPIILKKGEAIGQGIIKHYDITEDDAATGDRMGGFGSTSK